MDAEGNKTGGRQPGSPNKRTEALMDALVAAGMGETDTPAVFLYRVYSGKATFKQDVERKVVDDEGHEALITLSVTEPAPVPVRIQAAVACAKYVHPALKAVEVTGKDGENLFPPQVPWASLVDDAHVQKFLADRAASLAALPTHDLGAAPKHAGAPKARKPGPKLDPVKTL